MVELSYKEQRKQAKQEARKRFQNPYKVGDILHHSWGYDQTNCDFYQVVEVKKASVVLRPIYAKPVEGSQGFMSESLMPRKDAFIDSCSHALTKHDNPITPENPSILKRVGFYVQEDDSLKYYIPVPYGWCDLGEGKAEYSSWYA